MHFAPAVLLKSEKGARALNNRESQLHAPGGRSRNNNSQVMDPSLRAHASVLLMCVMWSNIFIKVEDGKYGFYLTT
jgi:hypothetical protein